MHNFYGVLPGQCVEVRGTLGALVAPWNTYARILSLTPLSVDDCGLLQLAVAYWVTFVTLLKVVDNFIHQQW